MDLSAFSPAQRAFVRRTLQEHVAFHPPSVPRALSMDRETVAALSRADRALGELSGVGKRLRNPRMLMRPYLHREAVLSSRIEGTQSSLSDLLLFEGGAPAPEGSDVREVLNYVRALEWGIEELRRLPLSLRVVLGLHERLLEGVRGEGKSPGRFRATQNWIGAPGSPIDRAFFVPPPPEALADALDDWEKYLHEQDPTPPLVRCALMHYQFETIHPFGDGNGRVGRLLIPLFLIEGGWLSQPLLYVSAYLERHRGHYYEALSVGRLSGDVRPWLMLFLAAIETQAQDAALRADQLTALEADYRGRLSKSRSRVVHGLVDELFSSMFVTASRVSAQQGVTPVSARAAIAELVSAGILREMTGRSYGRVYVAGEILDVIDRPNASAKPGGRARTRVSV